MITEHAKQRIADIRASQTETYTIIESLLDELQERINESRRAGLPLAVAVNKWEADVRRWISKGGRPRAR